MQIEYAKSSIEQLCTDQKRAQADLGKNCARKLSMYLSALRAAPTLKDVPPIGRLHELTGDRAGQFAFNLDKKMRLVFSPRLPKTGVLGLNNYKQSVMIVCIEYIGNYHD